MNILSRRKLIAAAAGASGLAVAARLADQYGLIPPDHGGLYGPGKTLTYAAQRLLTRHSMAREFGRDQISKAPFANGRSPAIKGFEERKADWHFTVDGMVARPMTFSLADLKAQPSRSQITHLACEEGWSFIAEWTGMPLAHVLETVGILPQAKFVEYFSLEPRWSDSVDMADALHPQTLLTYGMNGADLPVGHGGPLRVRVPRQLGYKSVKFITRLTVTDRLASASGSYAWYAGI